MMHFHMKSYIPVYSVVVLLCSVIVGTDGLQCYFCAGTGNTMPCMNHDTYKNTASCKSPEYRKNCTSPYDQMCTIETHATMGQTFVQLRDCNDGKTFYLQSANVTISDYHRIHDLKPDNETACVWDGQYMVCVTKCETDFCNGPQLDMQTCGAMNNFSLTFFTVYFISLLLYKLHSVV